MGVNQSLNYEKTREKPTSDSVATLYYFGGRGLADQVRWMLAASDISFTQKVIDSRSRFLKLAERQLPFGQLPLLQIDNVEIVQSQAILRYLARRSHLVGTSIEEETRCDMIAETIRDLLQSITGLPFARGKPTFDTQLQAAKDKWIKIASRLESIIKENNGAWMVGKSMTYADILMSHALTWYVEECGPSIVEKMPLLVNLQNKIIKLNGIQAYIKSQAYYPVGDAVYCQQVSTVLGLNV